MTLSRFIPELYVSIGKLKIFHIVGLISGRSNVTTQPPYFRPKQVVDAHTDATSFFKFPLENRNETLSFPSTCEVWRGLQVSKIHTPPDRFADDPRMLLVDIETMIVLSFSNLAQYQLSITTDIIPSSVKHRLFHFNGDWPKEWHPSLYLGYRTL
jgi:hypothetical protein